PARLELRAFRFVGLVFLWLSFGKFGPWLLLHQLPFFRSQHVPFRFAYPALLFLAIVAAVAAEERLSAWNMEKKWLVVRNAAVALLVMLAGADIVHESRQALKSAFGVEPRRVVARTE